MQIFIKRLLVFALIVTTVSFGGIAGATESGDTKMLIFPGNRSYTIEKTNGGICVKSGGTFDLSPFIKDGVLMVPVRGAFEEAGVRVTWKDGQVVLTRDEQTVVVKPDNRAVLINNTPAEMPTKSIICGGRTFVPLRFVAEQLNFQVTWNFVRNCAIISGL